MKKKKVDDVDVLLVNSAKKLDKLKIRNVIVGDPDELVNLKLTKLDKRSI